MSTNIMDALAALPGKGEHEQRGDIDLILSLIEKGARVLDLGCGDGLLLERLHREKGVYGRGVERDPQAILACMRRGIPVVGTPYGELPHLASGGGALVGEGARELADRVIELLGDEQQYRGRSEMALDTSVRYAVDSMADFASYVHNCFGAGVNPCACPTIVGVPRNIGQSCADPREAIVNKMKKNTVNRISTTLT
jgi:SAM-dependent methyltransferase